jgi:predicted DNA-binding protein
VTTRRKPLLVKPPIEDCIEELEDLDPAQRVAQ